MFVNKETDFWNLMGSPLVVDLTKVIRFSIILKDNVQKYTRVITTTSVIKLIQSLSYNHTIL